MKKKAEISEVMKKLSIYVAGALNKPLPKDVAERTRLHLLDTLAAMVSGSRLIPGERGIGYIKRLGGTKESAVIGTRIMTTAVNAAMANGISAHADETDDSHPGSVTHPGASVVSAALAMAQCNKDNGTKLLRAVALGYDIGTRLTMCFDLDTFYFVRGHHPPSFGGLFGAAAAAGALAKLDAQRMRYMFSYTAQQAAGLSCMFRDKEHIEKAFAMGGMPAHNGVQAALLAQHGFTGVGDVFSGDRNFFWAYEGEANPGELIRELGKKYEVMKTSIKKWPVGGPILGSLDATETLLKTHKFTADDIDKVVVKLAEDRARVVDNRDMPDICLQHLVALMLADRTVTFHSAHDEARMHDPKVLRIRKRTTLIGSPEMADPGRRWQGKVEITLRDGRFIEHYTYAAPGSWLNPMTREDEAAKALDLMAPVLGKKRAAAVIDAIWQIEKLKDVNVIGTLCRA